MALSLITPDSLNLAQDYAGMGFGGTGSANQLSDIETGTWTPTIRTGISSLSYNTQTGIYTKIDDMVYTDFYLRVSGTGSGSQFEIGGLPFNIASGNTRGGGTASYENIVGVTTSFYGQATNDFFSLYKDGKDGFSTTSSISNKYIIGTFIYKT